MIRGTKSFPIFGAIRAAWRLRFRMVNHELRSTRETGMTRWIRNCPVLISTVLASQIALVNQAVAQGDPAAKTAFGQGAAGEDQTIQAPSARERQLEYALNIAKAEIALSQNFVAQARRLLESCPRDLRRWEWHYLRRQCNSELEAVPWPDGVGIFYFSHDCSLAAMRSRGGISVRSVSVDKGLFGKELFELQDYRWPDFRPFSPDGGMMAVVRSRSVSVIDVSDGTTRKVINIPTTRDRERIVSVAVNSAGDRLAVVRFFTEDRNRRWRRELTIWDVATEKIVWTFEVPNTAWLIHFSPDEQLVAVGSTGTGGAEEAYWPGEVHTWNVETGKRVHRLQTYDPDDLPDRGIFLNDFEFSHDGKYVVTGDNGGVVKVWETSSGREIHRLKADNGGVGTVMFDRTGTRIVTGGDDQIVRVWDVATGKKINSIRGHDDWIRTAAFLDDRRIVSWAEDIRIWDAASSQTSRRYGGHREGSSVTGAAFAPHMVFSSDGRLYGTTDGLGGELWNAETGKLVHRLPMKEEVFPPTTFEIAFDPAGSHVATSATWGLAIWNQKTGKLVREIEFEDEDGSTCVAFTPDGKQLVTGHDEGEKDVPARITFWDVETGELKRTITVPGTEWMEFSLAPDGKRIAVIMDDHVAVLDTSDGARLLELRGHSEEVNGVAFSPDGDRIATCSDDSSVRIWDAGSGHELLKLMQGKDSPVKQVAFSPDGKHLSSAGNRVKIWDATAPGELGLQAAVVKKKKARQPKPLPKFPAPIAPARPIAAEQRPRITPANVSEIGVVKELEVGELGRGPDLVLGPAPGEFTALSHYDPMTVLDERELRPTREVVPGFKPVSFAVGRDGRRIAWGAKNRVVIETLTDHRQVVLDSKYGDLAFSPDGQLLATGGIGSRAEVWDVASGDLKFELDTDTRGDLEPQFSPDGKLIAVGDDTRKIHIFDAATGERLHILQHERPFRSDSIDIAFRPDGKVLATCIEIEIKLWDLSTGQELAAMELPGRSEDERRRNHMSVALTWNSTGSLLAFGGAGLHFVDPKTMQQLHTVPGLGVTREVLFTTDGTRVICSTSDVGEDSDERKIVSLAVPVKDALPPQTPIELKSSIPPSFGPNGKWFVTASGNDINLRDSRVGKVEQTFKGHTGRVNDAAFSPDGHQLASASDDSTIRVWEVHTGKTLLTMKGDDKEKLEVSWSPKGTWLVSYGARDHHRIWNAKTGESIANVAPIKARSGFSVSGARMGGFAFSPDDKSYVCADRDSAIIYVRDIRTGEKQLRLAGKRPKTDLNNLDRLVFSPDGSLIAGAYRYVGTNSEALKVWDAKTGQVLFKFKAPTQSFIPRPVFSPDSSRVMMALSRTVRAWDARTGNNGHEMWTYPSRTVYAEYFPDGRRIVSGGDDGKIRIFNALVGEELLSIDAGKTTFVTVNHDGTRLLSAAEKRSTYSVKLWHADGGKPAPKE